MKIFIPNYRDKAAVPKIKIHSYDLHNLDITLAIVIAAGLEKFKEIDSSAPCVDNHDVPEDLWDPNWVNDNDNLVEDTNYFKRWKYVLNEMWFAFDAMSNDRINFIKSDSEEMQRVTNGLRLFTKYYLSLWI